MARASAPASSTAPTRTGTPAAAQGDIPVVTAAMRRINRHRRLTWERKTQENYLRESDRIYEAIRSGSTDWLAELR